LLPDSHPINSSSIQLQGQEARVQTDHGGVAAIVKSGQTRQDGGGVAIKLSRCQLLDYSRRVVDDQLMLLDDLLMLLDARSRLDFEFEIAENSGRRRKSQTTDSVEAGRTPSAQAAWNAEQLRRLEHLIVFFLTLFEFCC